MDHGDKILTNIGMLIDSGNFTQAHILYGQAAKLIPESGRMTLANLIFEEDQQMGVYISDQLLNRRVEWCGDHQLIPWVIRFAHQYDKAELFLKAYVFAYLLKVDCCLNRYDQYIVQNWVEQPTEQNFKVMQGMINIANQMTVDVKALRAMGVEAYSYIYGAPDYLKYDIDFYISLSENDPLNEKLAKILVFIADQIHSYDIFHFHFGASMMDDYSDLELIRKFGKIVIMQHWGSDVRTKEMAEYITPYAVVKEGLYLGEEVLTKLSKLVNCCVVSDMELYSYVKPYYNEIRVVPMGIDLSSPSFTEIGGENSQVDNKFHIVHAPTSTLFKGTQYVNEAIENLVGKGYPIKYSLVEGMDNEAAIQLYKEADLIIDQLRAGTYGYLAVESMALGKPVISYVSDYMREKLPETLPLISANPENIEQVLEYYIHHASELETIGLNGKRYVEFQHDCMKTVGKLKNVYSEFARREK